MYNDGTGRQLLREHIKNKRANEGLEEIPEDLFAKKPRQEMSDEEKERMLERRRRNKEAAEKSRKKKKSEFEKLQNENDQLKQDNCELVAMVEKLKSDINSVVQENDMIQTNFDHLKRWIGKKADELGLTKYNRQDDQNMVKQPETDSTTTPILHADLTVFKSNSSVSKMEKLPSHQKTPSPPLGPSGGHSQPMEIQPEPPEAQLQTPWVVDSSVIKTKQPKTLQPFTQSQPLMVGEGQQVVVIPKDSIIILQGENRPVMTVSPDIYHGSTPKMAMEPSEKQNAGIPKVCKTSTVLDVNPSSSQAAHENMKGVTLKQGSIGQNTSSSMDPEIATAIESLLKLGYKVQMSEASSDKAPPVLSASADSDMAHSSDARDVLCIPRDTPESASTVTITTATDTETTSKFGSFTPLGCVAQLSRIQKLKEAGYPVHTMSTAPVLRVQD